MPTDSGTDADPQVAGFRRGEILAGRYRIGPVLGRGGMGVVVSAEHLLLGERVAIKFLKPDTMQNRDAIARFSREARVSVRIRSQHVVRVNDVGALDDGTLYMVMEYLDGIDLSEWLRTRGPLPVTAAASCVIQACDAIGEAHDLGIVHRDLKPSNLFAIRRPDGGTHIKVLDFGISKISAPELGSGRTGTHVVMGSPFYMSPEQMISSRDVDRRTDIWSLGVVLFELLSGRTPFLANSLTQLCIQVSQETAPRLGSVLPGAPRALELVVARCLQRDRNARYGTADELAAALLPFAPELAPAPRASDADGTRRPQTPTNAARHRAARTAGVLTLGVLGVSALAWLAPFGTGGPGSDGALTDLDAIETTAPLPIADAGAAQAPATVNGEGRDPVPTPAPAPMAPKRAEAQTASQPPTPARTPHSRPARKAGAAARVAQPAAPAAIERPRPSAPPGGMTTIATPSSRAPIDAKEPPASDLLPSDLLPSDLRSRHDPYANP